MDASEPLTTSPVPPGLAEPVEGHSLIALHSANHRYPTQAEAVRKAVDAVAKPADGRDAQVLVRGANTRFRSDPLIKRQEKDMTNESESLTLRLLCEMRGEMGEMKVAMNQLASALAALFQITAGQENHQFHTDTNISTRKTRVNPIEAKTSPASPA